MILNIDLNNVSPSRAKVGGTIFHIDDTADGIYSFWDANGDPVAAPVVGTDCTDWTYEVSGATKDKYYVYHSLVQGAFVWAYDGITTGATLGSNAWFGDWGSGKINTETILAIEDTTVLPQSVHSMWDYITSMRSENVNGCNDWYIGSVVENERGLWLSDTEARSWFCSCDIWSSVEYSSGEALLFYNDDFHGRETKTRSGRIVPIRSF